jgi:hypothetical protein
MSEEQRNEETEVEAHKGPGQGLSASDEPRDETDDEVEAHKGPGQGLSRPHYTD